MNIISVCKNVIASNNKAKWLNPLPAIRVARSKAGKVTARAHKIGIVDKNGEIVATMISTTDGKPVVKCGAKVALVTEFDIVVLDDEDQAKAA